MEPANTGGILKLQTLTESDTVTTVDTTAATSRMIHLRIVNGSLKDHPLRQRLHTKAAKLRRSKRTILRMGVGVSSAWMWRIAPSPALVHNTALSTSQPAGDGVVGVLPIYGVPHAGVLPAMCGIGEDLDRGLAFDVGVGVFHGQNSSQVPQVDPFSALTRIGTLNVRTVSIIRFISANASCVSAESSGAEYVSSS